MSRSRTKGPAPGQRCPGKKSFLSPPWRLSAAVEEELAVEATRAESRGGGKGRGAGILRAPSRWCPRRAGASRSPTLNGSSHGPQSLYWLAVQGPSLGGCQLPRRQGAHLDSLELSRSSPVKKYLTST